jgi:hypothetical protein
VGGVRPSEEAGDQVGATGFFLASRGHVLSILVYVGACRH